MRHITRHLQHYLPLVGILVAGFLGFWIFSYDRAFQMAIAMGLSAAYVSWGIVHHYIHKDLHTSVIVEYIAIALLGLVVIYSLIVRA
jgi:hypothetical protein